MSEVENLNNELNQMRKACHAVCGEAVGNISDNLTAFLTRLGNRILQQQAEIQRLQAELDKAKPKGNKQELKS